MLSRIKEKISSWFEFEDAEGRGVPDLLTEEEIAEAVAQDDSICPELAEAIDFAKTAKRCPCFCDFCSFDNIMGLDPFSDCMDPNSIMAEINPASPWYEFSEDPFGDPLGVDTYALDFVAGHEGYEDEE